ncbi:DUF7000 family protein [Paucibacter sp. DJ2R-2]|uniref:DUF7000 family protein n=1 Tax=Paucibacter sp. DJ2R-2 TaxID=2893558 RepID=UPI0021E4C702|nr:hypothetical protein [Paucibacter sp. DJ2R-2]MCV2420875.1 hypothetical protein [Paucibacter sp. DJ4R-1]MCV2440074.1 hypothetical protein [Paucibacter sp. DJ2R-2]
MPSQSLNARIPAYKSAFSSGELQRTYQDLVGVVQNLRTEFLKRYQAEFSVAAILHGYIDFTYFYLQNEYLKNKKLKLALVLNHQNANFELWLLGQTKDVQILYWKKLRGAKWVNPEAMPAYSVFEALLLAAPDFDDAAKLTETVCGQFETLLREILEVLESCE